jgi:hypothetical protein
MTRLIPTLLLLATLVGCFTPDRLPPAPVEVPEVVEAREAPIPPSPPVEPAASSLLPFFHQTVIIETNHVVFVGGEVRNPVRMYWFEGLTLTNAIVLAGGFTDFADKTSMASGLTIRSSFQSAFSNVVISL